MPAVTIDKSLADRLYRRAGAERWNVPAEVFAEVLQASANRAFAAKSPSSGEVARYLHGLHLQDLALAAACACGDEAAWHHFVQQYRPVLYRSADALDRTGAARDLADSLYAEFFGLEERDGTRQSLFRYFHGRSTLATWMRAVLAQRHIDRLRAEGRSEPLPAEPKAEMAAAPSEFPESDRARYVSLMRHVLRKAVARLIPRDRLRLALYYAQELTLADIGRLLREHEATVSRRLAKTRRAIRVDVERQLRSEAHLNDDQIEQCLEYVMEDAGSIDLTEMLATAGPGKKMD